MTFTNVVTMQVTIPVYTMFIVCPSDCDVTVNQKYVSYYILNKINYPRLDKWFFFLKKYSDSQCC